MANQRQLNAIMASHTLALNEALVERDITPGDFAECFVEFILKAAKKEYHSTAEQNEESGNDNNISFVDLRNAGFHSGFRNKKLSTMTVWPTPAQRGEKQNPGTPEYRMLWEWCTRIAKLPYLGKYYSVPPSEYTPAIKSDAVKRRDAATTKMITILYSVNKTVILLYPTC